MESTKVADQTRTSVAVMEQARFEWWQTGLFEEWEMMVSRLKQLYRQQKPVKLLIPPQQGSD